jgi:hypothetical protein
MRRQTASRLGSRVRLVRLYDHNAVFAAERGIKELQASACAKDWIRHWGRRKADDRWPTPRRASVIAQFQIHIAKPQGIRLSAPANGMPGSGSESYAEHSGQA